MDPELSKKLNECGVKKSLIEVQLKMPKNSLAGMMNGTRPTPKKWEESLWQFIKYTETVYEKTSFDGVFKKMVEADEHGQLEKSETFYFNPQKGIVPTTVTDGEPVTVTVQFPPKDNLLKELEEGINTTLEYCRTVGISLQELVRGYMKWREVEMKDKPKITGEGKKEYNPNDNWRYNSKLGKKD